MSKFSELKGKTITSAFGLLNGSEIVDLKCSDGTRYKMYHEQSCCESVSIEDVAGDVEDIIGSPILLAEEVSSDEWPEGLEKPKYKPDSFTWTFYKLSTIKGSITIRWYGSSNGYYSESVTFKEV